MQQVLTVKTHTDKLRSPIWDSIREDPSLVDNGDPTNTPYVEVFWYKNVLHALSDGWKLLGPPVYVNDDAWVWWLVR